MFNRASRGVICAAMSLAIGMGSLVVLEGDALAGSVFPVHTSTIMTGHVGAVTLAVRQTRTTSGAIIMRSLVTYPGAISCDLSIAIKKVRSALPSVAAKTGRAGWTWTVNPGAPAGRWKLSASCRRSVTVATTTRVITVNPKSVFAKGITGSPVVALGTLNITAGHFLVTPRYQGAKIKFKKSKSGGKGAGGGNPFAANDSGYCTFGAWEKASWIGNGVSGDAGSWKDEAAANGFQVGRTPVVGAIFVVVKTSDDPWGHVGVVTGILSATSFATVEMNGGNWSPIPALRNAGVTTEFGKFVAHVESTGPLMWFIYKPGTGPSAPASSPASQPSQSEPATSPPNAATFSETTGGLTNTWSNYSDAGGTAGTPISAYTTVQISCKVTGLAVSDGNTWWYAVESSPWDNSFFASADAFYNNGTTAGALTNTPFVDSNVPNCKTSTPTTPPVTTPPVTTPPVTTPPVTTPPVTPTHSETVGGVSHTWTNYSDAGGSQGPSIASYETVQISCKVTGFKVADGNTWWYRIASAPWNNGYYVSADAFYNDGATSGSLSGTPFVDNNVPNC